MTQQKKPFKKPSLLFSFSMVLLGFAVGIAVFMPWEKLCVRLVEYVDAQLVNTRFTWKDLRRAGPSGFRVDDLVVGFANSPGALSFQHADLRFGVSPLARVRLNTGGPECLLHVEGSGQLTVQGKVDLTFLFGRSGLQGVVDLQGTLTPSVDGRLPGTGWFELRAPALQLPDGTVCNDVFATVVVEETRWIIKNLSFKKPVDYQGKGVLVLDENNVPGSMVSLKGEIMLEGLAHPYVVEKPLLELLQGKNI